MRALFLALLLATLAWLAQASAPVSAAATASPEEYGDEEETEFALH